MERENVIKEKSYQLALSVIQLVRTLPKRSEMFVLCDQLCRSGTSVGANVEEAIAAFSKKDFVFRMNVALKEARETHYWLRMLRDSGLLKNNEIEPILLQTEEVMRILGAIVKNSRT